MSIEKNRHFSELKKDLKEIWVRNVNRELNNNSFTNELKAALKDKKLTKKEARELWKLFFEKTKKLYHVKKIELNRLRKIIWSNSDRRFITEQDLRKLKEYGFILGKRREKLHRTNREVRKYKKRVGRNIEINRYKFKELLDFIALAEWTWYRYNIKFWHKRTPNLSKMTLRQVLNYQKRIKWHTAIWRYQFKKNNLAELARIFGYNTKMTPDIQDKIAIYLILNKRKWKRFLKWRISQKYFMKLLAYEWASLPLPNWKSIYHWDRAWNHSRVSYRKFKQIIRNLRNRF